MAGASKADALAMFLTESQALRQKTAERPADDDFALPGRVVILTILCKQAEPMSQEQLMARSELPPAEFGRVVGHLDQMRWIETRNGGLRLTEAGREAAEQERQRLLRFG